MGTILLPGTLDGAPRVPQGLRAVTDDVTAPPPPAAPDADAVVVRGDPDGRLRELAAATPQVRWVQTLMAGADALLAAGSPRRPSSPTGAACTTRP